MPAHQLSTLIPNGGVDAQLWDWLPDRSWQPDRRDRTRTRPAEANSADRARRYAASDKEEVGPARLNVQIQLRDAHDGQGVEANVGKVRHKVPVDMHRVIQ